MKGIAGVATASEELNGEQTCYSPGRATIRLLEIEPVSDRILLHSIEFYGYHGASAEERRIGHRFAADVILHLDLAHAGRSDSLELTIDYRDVCRQVLSVGEGTPVTLVETLAERIAAACLNHYPAVAEVEVRVRKLQPPLPAIVGAAEVAIRRTRGQGG